MYPKRPADITALSLFFAIGALLCAVASVMIHHAGTLHSVWRAIPAIATLGNEAVSWLLFVAVVCLLAALGLWRCSYWGYLAASLLLIVGCSVHFFRALVEDDWWKLFIVAAMGVLILFYLRIRAGLFVHRGS